MATLLLAAAVTSIALVVIPRATAAHPSPARAVASAPASTSAPAAGDLPLVALPTGAPAYGVGGAPVVWHPSSDPALSVTATTDGVKLQLASTGREFWVTAPVDQGNPAIRVDADVTLTAAPGDRLGVGCRNTARTAELILFLITGDGSWSILVSTDGTYGGVLAQGQVSGIRPAVAANHLSGVCGSSQGGQSLAVMFAINGVPVANSALPAATTSWRPTVALCSCFGPSEATYAAFAVSNLPPR